MNRAQESDYTHLTPQSAKMAPYVTVRSRAVHHMQGGMRWRNVREIVKMKTKSRLQSCLASHSAMALGLSLGSLAIEPVAGSFWMLRRCVRPKVPA